MILRKPRILLLAVSLTFAWIFYFVVYIQGYDIPLNQLQFLYPPKTPKPTAVVEHSQTVDNAASGGPRVLLVSAIYPIAKVKAPDYDKHLPLYLGSVTTDLYIFTSPELEAEIRSLTLSVPSRRLTLNTTYASPMDIPPIFPHAEAYARMRKKDRAKSKHPPELYAYSNSRAYFLERAVNAAAAEGIHYDFAFWNEASSFHQEGHFYSQWPSPERIQEVWDEAAELENTEKDELIFFPMSGLPHPSMSFWVEGMGPLDNRITQGTFFGGTPKGIDWFARTFYAYHEHFMLQGLFVGKEQALINSLAFLFPRHFITVWYNDPAAPAHLSLLDGTSPDVTTPRKPDHSFLGRCSSEFFYYQFFLSDQDTQDAMRKLWIAGGHPWLSSVWDWVWRTDQTPCQVTRVISMADVLARTYGDGWGVKASLPVPATVPWATT